MNVFIVVMPIYLASKPDLSFARNINTDNSLSLKKMMKHDANQGCTNTSNGYLRSDTGVTHLNDYNEISGQRDARTQASEYGKEESRGLDHGRYRDGHDGVNLAVAHLPSFDK